MDALALVLGARDVLEGVTLMHLQLPVLNDVQALVLAKGVVLGVLNKRVFLAHSINCGFFGIFRVAHNLDLRQSHFLAFSIHFMSGLGL